VAAEHASLCHVALVVLTTRGTLRLILVGVLLDGVENSATKLGLFTGVEASIEVLLGGCQNLAVFGIFGIRHHYRRSLFISRNWYEKDSKIIFSCKL